jgi:uncharacterized protein YcbK (DUF882 family)
MAFARDIIRQEQAVACSRREFLRIGSGVAASLLLPASGLARAASHRERSLNFYNTHTDERLKTCYWAEGDYLPEGLQEINTILRDHRTGDIHDMDRGLLDLLYLLQTKVESKRTFQIISGYRSPKTNAMLSKQSNGVAKRSYHMQGMAIDVRLNGCDLKQLHKAALSLKAGGVGYYPSSDFIHVDVGRVRRW